MPRTQTSEYPPAATLAEDTPVAGATLVAEAPTAEAALAEVHATYGADARIVAAKRVLRGGIGGFFAKEVVQIHAAAADEPTAVPPPVEPSIGVSSPIDRLLADADTAPEEIDFATFLRRQLAPDTVATEAVDGPTAEPTDAPGAAAATEQPPTPPPPTAPVTWPEAADLRRPAWADAGEPTTAGLGTVTPVVDADVDTLAGDARAWSRTTLVRLGLPVAFVQSLDVADPADDVAWTFALAEALRPLCRPLPTGRALLVGPRARGLATAIGMPVTSVGQPLHALGDVAAAVTGSASSLQWLDRAREGRWLHLVVGGKGWRDLLHRDPLAVSWASEEYLPEALRVAVELGLVLGYGPLGGTSGRARPLDVALAVRDLVPVR